MITAGAVVVCCKPGVVKPVRNTRRNHAKQLNKTLRELSELTKTSTAKQPGTMTKIDDALHDVSLLTRSICKLDLKIEEHEEHEGHEENV